jgi:phosphate transport system substrate-binding protein
VEKQEKKFKRYCIITGLMALLLSPIAASVGLIGVYFIAPPILTLALVWVLYSWKAKTPEKASELFLPIFLAFCYYMCVWIIVFGLANYRYDSELFKAYWILTLPYYIFNVLFAIIMGNFHLFPLLNLIVLVVTLLSIIIMRAIRKKKIIYDKKLLIYGLIILCLFGVVGYQFYDRSTKFLKYDYQAERIDEEVNLYAYNPFNPINRAQGLNEPATITFTRKYPRLDGATAAYPVYAAMAYEIYQGLDEQTFGQYVACSKTDRAYERLINGEIDIFFGAQPSRQQRGKREWNWF